MRYTGKVKQFFAKTGYGFIEPLVETGGKDIIVHHKEVTRRHENEFVVLYEGERVEFDLENTDRGYRATSVLRVN